MALDLAIGRAGEMFVSNDCPVQAVILANLFQVYELLKQELGMTYDCWTSNSRSHSNNLPPFLGDKVDYADFTIHDPSISAKMTDWLLKSIKISAAASVKDFDVIYHVEVKTTSGHMGEAFDLSTNQMRLVSFSTLPHDACTVTDHHGNLGEEMAPEPTRRDAHRPRIPHPFWLALVPCLSRPGRA